MQITSRLSLPRSPEVPSHVSREGGTLWTSHRPGTAHGGDVSDGKVPFTKCSP